uniref:hypothetical protein n=1 Tax=Thaumasiovibrio occultus TaxID=1891184 RepID=UPI000B35E6A8|nr:hypothetical protein [Thaumasiovibrio occultus]
MKKSTTSRKEVLFWWGANASAFFYFAHESSNSWDSPYLALGFLIGLVSSAVIPLPNLLIAMFFKRMRNWGSVKAIFCRWQIGLLLFTLGGIGLDHFNRPAEQTAPSSAGAGKPVQMTHLPQSDLSQNPLPQTDLPPANH